MEWTFTAPTYVRPYKPFVVELTPIIALPAMVDGKPAYAHEWGYGEPVKPQLTDILSVEFTRRLGRMSEYPNR